jgi:F-type H+-transporting ATPase subunit delta
LAQSKSTSGKTVNNMLARRYAGALFELADEQGQLDVIAADLRLVKILTSESAEFRQITSHPRLKRSDLIDAMQQVAKTGKLHALTTNFLKLVAQGRRLNQLSAIVDAFLKQLADQRGELAADVHVAHPLTEAQREKLAAQLKQLASSNKVQLTVTEDPSLLGGMTVKLGSHLIDASVKTKLARLERQLKSQEEAA